MLLQANREVAEDSLRGTDVVRESNRVHDRMKRRVLLRHLEKYGCEFLRKVKMLLLMLLL